MESRPGRRLRLSPPPEGADLIISVLPDEILHLVIARISCVRTMVRTGLISRRWRGLWIGLATCLTIRDSTPAVTQALLARFAVVPPAFALHIRLSKWTTYDSIKEANSLLRTTATFSPSELVFTLTQFLVKYAVHTFDVELPCFHRATSIEIDTVSLPIIPPPAGEFTALESLSLKGKIVDLGSMLDRCPRLRTVSLAFCGVAPDSVEATLTALQARTPGASLCLLDICIDKGDCINGPRFASLLRAVTRVSPKELVLTRGFDDCRTDDAMTMIAAELPSFDRATSIKLSLRSVCFTQLPAAEFSALEKLHLSGCNIVDLATLVARCPRLRVLTLIVRRSTSNFMVHSPTLQELNVYSCQECQSIDIVTPVLHQLILEVEAYMDLSVSISAPLVEKVMWERSFIGLASVFGFWSLRNMSLITDRLGAELDVALEMEKILVIEFSILELHLEATNHVPAALVSCLLGMDHIRTATQRLKATRECQNCPCDEPNKWRNRIISLPCLEGVEIEGFNGELIRHLDLLKLVLRCASMLKTVTIKLTSGLHRENFRGGFRKIHNIFLAYPSMSYSVYLHTGGLFRRAHG